MGASLLYQLIIIQILKMSVKKTQSPSQYEKANQKQWHIKKRSQQQNIYEKFQKAHQNMQNFQQMLTKFSTHRKPITTDPSIRAFCSNSQSNNFPTQKKTTTIMLQQGWQYSGQIFQGKFHGYGNIVINGQNVYTGEFNQGKMNGIGKLFHHQIFEQLINVQSKWLKYEGQFKDSQVTGYGNLFLTNGMVIIGYWRKGKPQYYTKIDSQGFNQ